MANIFEFRNKLIDGYRSFSRSFTKFAADDIDRFVTSELDAANTFCPEPLIQINPSYAENKYSLAEYAATIGARGVPMLHERCIDIFAVDNPNQPWAPTTPLHLYHHQGVAIAKADAGESYVVTSGTGSGKSLTFFIPIVSRILQEKERDAKPRIRAIIVYPMNALANSQLEEINKYLDHCPGTIKVKRYTGQEGKSEREGLYSGEDIPDILLTNYMMLELMLLRPSDSKIIEHCRGLNFLVLDELHTYRGRQGSDVALLVNRLRQRVGRTATEGPNSLICIGTSATMSSVDNVNAKDVVAKFACKIFGQKFNASQIIEEQLKRETADDVYLNNFDELSRGELREKLASDVESAARNDFSFLLAKPKFGHAQPEDTLAAFKESRLAIYLEQMLSVELNEQKQWRRAQPKSLDTVAQALCQTIVGAKLSGNYMVAPEDQKKVREALINFMNFISDPSKHNLRNELGRTPFAFKLHQFISSPGQLSVSLEAPGIRKFALDGKNNFVERVNERREKAEAALGLAENSAATNASGEDGSEEEPVLHYPAFEVRFCQQCGQEYIPVWLRYRTRKQGRATIDTLESVRPRELTNTNPDLYGLGSDIKEEPGFVCPVDAKQKYLQVGLDLLPAEWRDPEHPDKLKRPYRNYEPLAHWLNRLGQVCAKGSTHSSEFWVIRGDFRICLKCGERSNTQANIHNRLIGLSGEGRSTASTTISLLTLRQLYQGGIAPDKRKLLGFSDNRQDAALQAGHFNDFVKNLTLRSCLTAVLLQQLDQSHGAAANEGMRLDELIKNMELLLGWGGGKPSLAGRALFLENPDDELSWAYQALKDDYFALHSLLSYHVTLDLSESYLYTCPSLERLGLLRIDYCNLVEHCYDDSLFAHGNPVTRQASLLTYLTPEYRIKLFKIFLDELRRRRRMTALFLKDSEQINIRSLLNRDFSERWLIGRDEWKSEGWFVCLDSTQEPEKKKKRTKVIEDVWTLSHRSRLNSILRSNKLWDEFRQEYPERHAMLVISKEEIQDTLAAMCQYLAQFHILRTKITSDGERRYSVDVNMLKWRLGEGLKTLEPGVSVDFYPNEAHGNPGYFYRELYRMYAQDFISFAATSALALHQTVEIPNAAPAERDGSLTYDALKLPAIFSFEAHEHTAQLSNAERQELELRFRGGEVDRKKWEKMLNHSGKTFRFLPLLFCSPTMELGIDISALNFVYMRNVPPTAANYVQRAGRAGRSGQPALVMTYCTSRNAHDQWFFKNPQDMVQGVVREPTLDLTNDALLQAHLHSIWLSCALANLPQGVEIKHHVAQLLTGVEPGDFGLAALSDPQIKNASDDKAHLARLREIYALKPELAVPMQDKRVEEQALALGEELLHNLMALASPEEQAILYANWVEQDGLKQLMGQAYTQFNYCFDYWRELYFSNLREYNTLTSKSDESERRQNELREQLRLLKGEIGGDNSFSDFYIFRYLASQGFLPGYSFPAMPLMAWIPSPEGATVRSRRASFEQRGDWLSRARFLGINEFGPNNLIYHNGRIYRCTRLKLSACVGMQAARNHSNNNILSTTDILVCPRCGHYVVKLGLVSAVNECSHCKHPFDRTYSHKIGPLYQVSVVETRRVERITMADEERQRQGFDLRTFYQFTGTNAHTRCNIVNVSCDDSDLVKMTYGASAQIMRANLGLRGHADDNKGYVINAISGEWVSKERLEELSKLEGKTDAQFKPELIIPYVRDTRNILILDLTAFLESWGFNVSSESSLLPDDREQVRAIIATLQAALGRAITKHFQIELSEIFLEPLPSRESPRQLLIYESGEGGSGVLNRLSQLPEDGQRPALAQVAEVALEIMHYEKKGDLADEPWDASKQERYDQRPDCMGCYDCLLTYYNQPDHERINRKNQQVFSFLTQLTRCELSNNAASAFNSGKGAFQFSSPKASAQEQKTVPAFKNEPPVDPKVEPEVTPKVEVKTEPMAVASKAESLNSDPKLLQKLRYWLIEEGYIMPDAMPWTLKRQGYDLAAVFKSSNCALSFEPLPEKVFKALSRSEVTCLQLNPDGSNWDEVFAKYAEDLGLIDD